MNGTVRLFVALPLAACLWPVSAHAQDAAPAPAPKNYAPAPAPQTYAPAPAPQTYAPPPPGSYPPPPPPGYYAPGYAPPPGYAVPPGYVPPPPPGFHTHDGTYVRLHFGGAYATFSTSDPILGKAEFSGGGASLGVAVGGAIVPNLVLYGTFIMAGATGPELKIEGMSQGSANGDLDIIALGGGAAYYLTPLNLYFAGSLLAAQLQASNSNGRATGDTDFGLGFEGLIGKEWWVSDNWGLGVAGQVLYATMTDKALDSSGNPFKWTATSFALLFSATFN